MTDKNSLNSKVKVLNKLFDAGYKTEKSLKDLNLQSILKIPGITVPDMTAITEIQEQVAKNKLYSYLGGDLNEHGENC